MGIIALFTWIIAAGGGLYLVSIWLIEYDKEFQSAAATRLPPAVLVSHVTLAGGGLIIWAGYLLFDNDDLVWVAAVALLLAATLGSFMAFRWVGVYRETQAIRQTTVALGASSPPGATSQLAARPTSHQIATLARPVAGPPERNFPLPVVIGHGIFAVTTLTLVLLTAFGAFGS